MQQIGSIDVVGDGSVSENLILDALKNCYDPEIPINIVDLGLVYNIGVNKGVVSLEMTLTARGCPMYQFIALDVKEKLERVEGVQEASVEVVWEPEWTIERLSQEAREQLGIP